MLAIEMYFCPLPLSPGGLEHLFFFSIGLNETSLLKQVLF